MDKFKTVLSVFILLAMIAALIYFEVDGRDNRSTLKASAPETNLFTLYGDDHISFEEVDGIRVRTYFAEEKLELAAGVHTIKVSYKKRKFWILFTNEITSEFVFKDMEFFSGEQLAVVGTLNEKEDVVYFSIENRNTTVSQ